MTCFYNIFSFVFVVYMVILIVGSTPIKVRFGVSSYRKKALSRVVYTSIKGSPLQRITKFWWLQELEDLDLKCLSQLLWQVLIRIKTLMVWNLFHHRRKKEPLEEIRTLILIDSGLMLLSHNNLCLTQIRLHLDRFSSSFIKNCVLSLLTIDKVSHSDWREILHNF